MDDQFDFSNASSRDFLGNRSNESTFDWASKYGGGERPHSGETERNIGLIVGQLILSLIVVVANGSLISVYITRETVRETFSTFMLNLMAVDFQNGLFILPITAFFPRGDALENINEYFCLFVTIWTAALGLVSKYSVMLVTIERFIHIWRPYESEAILCRRNCLIVIAILWVYGILYSAVPAYIPLAATTPRLDECRGLYFMSEEYVISGMALNTGLPFLIMMVLYAQMYRIARRHILRIAVSAPSVGNNNEGQRLSKNTKAAKTALLITVFYVCSWYPLSLNIQLYTICIFENMGGRLPPVLFCMDHISIMGGLALLAFVNSALNPIFYGLRNEVIRRSFKKMACWRYFALKYGKENQDLAGRSTFATRSSMKEESVMKNTMETKIQKDQNSNEKGTEKT